MRIGLVGLSTPIFYDYKTQVRKAPSDLSDSPNPILDSPMGIFLLFDEVWFLCRSLCPENMRSLPYAKFLDEAGMLPALEDIQFPDFWEEIKSDPTLSARLERLRRSFSVYRDKVRRVGVHWDAAPDNHTHGLKIGSITTSGNSVSAEKVQFDLEVAKRLSRRGKHVELVTNTFTQRWLDDPDSPFLKIQMSELIVIERIPNFLTRKGPYHPCVEEVRANRYLKDFRKWVMKRKVSCAAEVAEAKREVEEAIAKAKRQLFLKYYDPKTEYKSIGKTMLGFGTELVPGASTVMGAIELAGETKEALKKRQNRWQAFLVSLEANAQEATGSTPPRG